MNGVTGRHRPVGLDDGSLARLIAGELPPGEVPRSMEPVARLIRALTAPPTAEELARGSEAIAVASAILRSRTGTREPIKLRRERVSELAVPRRRPGRLRVTGLIAAAMLVGTAGLAAAGGLPAPAQEAAAKVFSWVGIEVPNPSESVRPEPSGIRTGPPGSQDPDGAPIGTGAGDGSNGKGGEISEIATSTDAEGVGKGAEISNEASGGKSHAGEGGRSEEHGPPEEQGNRPEGAGDGPRGPSDERSNGPP